jgi:hypothetical protein
MLSEDVVRFNQPSQIKYIVEASGAKFEGIQKIKGKDKYAVATDRLTGSTYYLPIEKLTKKKVQTKLNRERGNRIRYD